MEIGVTLVWFSTCGGPRVGTVLFGLVLALELQAINVDIGQLIPIFQNISMGRQFILSKKQSDEGRGFE